MDCKKGFSLLIKEYGIIYESRQNQPSNPRIKKNFLTSDMLNCTILLSEFLEYLRSGLKFLTSYHPIVLMFK